MISRHRERSVAIQINVGLFPFPWVAAPGCLTRGRDAVMPGSAPGLIVAELRKGANKPLKSLLRETSCARFETRPEGWRRGAPEGGSAGPSARKNRGKPLKRLKTGSGMARPAQTGETLRIVALARHVGIRFEAA